MKKTEKKAISYMQLILTIVFIVTILICNIVTVKQIQLPFGLVMTGAAFLFPITYVLSDIFSEIYGYKWSRIVSYLGFAMNLFMVIIFTLVIIAPAPDYYAKQDALQTILGSTPRVLLASLTAYMVGDFVNDRVFKRMKTKNPNSFKGFQFRAILSSLCGLIVDSSIFLPLAFLGVIPNKVLLTMMLSQVLIKISCEIILLPVTTLVVKKVDKHEKAIKI
ncbi:MAG: queuosine precursor transporter [Bacilli bacterium]|nr:queuosine precursor transporter [Bacilli bacterium]